MPWIGGVRGCLSRASGVRSGDRRHAPRAGPARDAARRSPTVWLRAPMPRRPASSQHRPPRRAADAVRWRRVQRRDRLHRRLLRSGVPVDGSLAPAVATPRQRRDEPLSLRDRRHRRPIAAAALPLLPGGGPRQNECATAARLQSDGGQRESLQSSARQYLALAGELLHPPRPSLIAIGGFSGSGKSTLALSLAPTIGAVPGAVVLRSDEIRKRLSGVSPLDRSPRRPGVCASRQRTRLHDSRRDRGGSISGPATASSSMPSTPAAPTGTRSSTSRHAPRCRLWDYGSTHPNPRSSPVPNGSRRHDASDADAAVIRTQLSQDTGSIDWHRLDASGAAPAVLERGLACLELHVPHSLNGHHTMNGVTHALA